MIFIFFNYAVFTVSLPYLGIVIQADGGGIGIPAFRHMATPSRSGSFPVPDWAPFFRYQTVSGKGIFVFSPVPDWLDARQSGIPEFKKHFKKLKRDTYTLHVYTASDGF